MSRALNHYGFLALFVVATCQPHVLGKADPQIREGGGAGGGAIRIPEPEEFQRWDERPPRIPRVAFVLGFIAFGVCIVAGIAIAIVRHLEWKRMSDPPDVQTTNDAEE